MAVVTVQMPAFNAEAFIARAIDSVVSQTFTDFRLDVIDDGSTDRTRDIVERYASEDDRVRLIARPQNGGEGACRNTGLAQMDSDSDFLAFLDCDDVWEPESLEVRLRALEVAPASVGAFGQYFHTGEDGTPLDRTRLVPAERWTLSRFGRRRQGLGEPTTIESFAYRFCIVPGAIIVRREVIALCGVFDIGLPNSADDDMWIRLLTEGPIEFVPQPVIAYRLHDGNATADLPQYSTTRIWCTDDTYGRRSSAMTSSTRSSRILLGSWPCGRETWTLNGAKYP